MIRVVVAACVLLGLASPAWAIERNCPKGQVWSISLGTCVKRPKPVKLSPQEKFEQANDDLEGRGRKPDPARGVKTLLETCGAGHAPSCTLLGFLHARGRHGLVRDDAQAMEFFVKACKLNDVEGCYHIGDTGFRIAEYAAARVAFTRACSLDSGFSCARGADLYERGIGGAADPATALTMYQKANTLLAPTCPGDGLSCLIVGILLEDGKGIAKDQTKAIAAYRSGCTGGNGDACTHLARVLEANKDLDGANEALERSCNRYDNSDACRKLAERLGMAKKDLDRAFALAKRGCTLDASHCGTLGEFYRLGFGTQANATEATRLYKASCEAGGSWCDTFGERAHDGVGMTRDDAAAIAMLERGCKGGSAPACRVGAKVLIDTKSDDARGFTLGEMGCEFGNGMACYLAGWMLAQGRAGGPASPERAFKLYEKGCGLDAPVACSAQGDAYRAGAGVTKDLALALKKFDHACTGNATTLYAGACKQLGVMTYFGEAGSKDNAAALTAFRRACQYGEPDTCGWLSTVAIESGGKAADELPIVEKACAAGHEHACIAHGNLLLASTTETDRRAAYAVFVAACGRKNEDGCVRQADLLADGTGVTQDTAKAEELYRARCDAGSANACNGMGRLLYTLKKHDEALRINTRACEAGSADACSSVGYAYYTALGTRWDVARAATFFIKACELGSNIGCSNAGDVYRFGAGVPRDHAKAFAVYEKACTPALPAGCAGMGHYLATGEGNITADNARAETALRTACSSVYEPPDACRDLADLLERMRKGTPAELARLRTTAFSGATQNAKDNPYYMYLLGAFHEAGVATMRDPQKALEWYGKACDGYDPLGCIAAGRLLRATNTAADTERARVYLERACAAGVEDGCALGATPAAAPPPVAKAKGCGCAGEIAGGDASAVVLVLGLLLRRRRAAARRA